MQRLTAQRPQAVESGWDWDQGQAPALVRREADRPTESHQQAESAWGWDSLSRDSESSYPKTLQLGRCCTLRTSETETAECAS
jgi:hypothetical protein